MIIIKKLRKNGKQIVSSSLNVINCNMICAKLTKVTHTHITNHCSNSYVTFMFPALKCYYKLKKPFRPEWLYIHISSKRKQIGIL